MKASGAERNGEEKIDPFFFFFLTCALDPPPLQVPELPEGGGSVLIPYLQAWGQAGSARKVLAN